MKSLEEMCQAKGLRMTAPRRLVIALLEAASDHPDAITLHQRALEQDALISIATVYRTLTLLEELELVQRRDFGDGRARYEDSEKGLHDHLINVQTGEIMEFQDDLLDALKKQVAEQLGYELKGHRVELYGRPLTKDDTKK